MTVLAGFPVNYLEKIDRRIAHICISLYYGMMSVLSLNLFIALLSQSFTSAYCKAVKLTLLEQAKSILIAEKFLSDRKREKYFNYLHSKCRPLVCTVYYKIGPPRYLQNRFELTSNFLASLPYSKDFYMFSKCYPLGGCHRSESFYDLRSGTLPPPLQGITYAKDGNLVVCDFRDWG